MYNGEPHPCSTHYNITMKAASNSTLPPILNAFEYFSVISTANLATVINQGMKFYSVHEILRCRMISREYTFQLFPIFQLGIHLSKYLRLALSLFF
jgi:hypothetical protein